MNASMRALHRRRVQRYFMHYRIVAFLRRIGPCFDPGHEHLDCTHAPRHRRRPLRAHHEPIDAGGGDGGMAARRAGGAAHSDRALSGAAAQPVRRAGGAGSRRDAADAANPRGARGGGGCRGAPAATASGLADAARPLAGWCIWAATTPRSMAASLSICSRIPSFRRCCAPPPQMARLLRPLFWALNKAPGPDLLPAAGRTGAACRFASALQQHGGGSPMHA